MSSQVHLFLSYLRIIFVLFVSTSSSSKQISLHPKETTTYPKETYMNSEDTYIGTWESCNKLILSPLFLKESPLLVETSSLSPVPSLIVTVACTKVGTCAPLRNSTQVSRTCASTPFSYDVAHASKHAWLFGRRGSLFKLTLSSWKKRQRRLRFLCFFLGK